MSPSLSFTVHRATPHVQHHGQYVWITVALTDATAPGEIPTLVLFLAPEAVQRMADDLTLAARKMAAIKAALGGVV